MIPKQLMKTAQLIQYTLILVKHLTRTVPHYRLLHKLKSMGINKNTSLWIKDFLSERRQRVVINGVQSQWGAVKSGVPQGSVYVPILFLIYCV